MNIILGLAGVVCSFFLLKYREAIGSLMGEAEWMRKVGGVYNLVIIIAIAVFFWSVAVMTGTTAIFLQPVLWLLPGVGSQSSPVGL